MSEVNPIEAAARAAGDVYERYGQSGELRSQRPPQGLLEAMQRAALTAISENITVEMVEAAMWGRDGTLPAAVAKDVFRVMLNQAMKEQG